MGFQQTPRTSRPARVARRGQAGQGVWGLYFHGLTSVLPSCRDARPGASVGASSAHANGQRRSRQFRVEGLGFRVEGLGFGGFFNHDRLPPSRSFLFLRGMQALPFQSLGPRD